MTEAKRGPGELLWAGGVWVTTFGLYLATMSRGLTGGDAGELIVAAASGGVAHPPGYPLFLLIGRMLGLLPRGELAFRFNLFSGLCGATAATILFLGASRWSGSRGAAVVAVSMFSCAPSVWLMSTGAEVFGLNNLLVACVLFCAIRFAESSERRWALLGAFAAGLGLSNQHESLLSSLPLAAWAVGSAPELRRRREILWLALAFVAGLAPYAYLPFAGDNAAPVTWGETNTWSGFWTHVMRSEYGTLRLSSGGEMAGFASVAAAWARSAVGDLGWGGIAAVTAGSILACRRQAAAPGLGRAVGIAALVPVVVFGLLANLPATNPLEDAVYARFWQQPLLLASTFAAQGIAAALRHLPSRRLAGGLCAVAAVVPPALHFRALDHHADRIIESYGAELLRVAPPGALVIARTDLIINSIRYLQFAEGQRRDVRVVEDELLSAPWARLRLRQAFPALAISREVSGDGDQGLETEQVIAANLERSPILLCGGIENHHLGVPAHFSLWPMGLCQRVERRTGADGTEPAAAIDSWLAESEAALPGILSTPQLAGSWEAVVSGDYWAARELRALKLMEVAGRDPARRRYLDEAAGILEAIAVSEPNPPPRVARSLAAVEALRHAVPRHQP